MSDDPLRLVHAHSAHHRDEVLRSARCGCFCCERTFGPGEVREWTDGGDTALCPRCGIDSVLGDAGVSVDAELLRAMRRRWFGVS